METNSNTDIGHIERETLQCKRPINHILIV